MKLIHSSGWKDKEKLEFKTPLINNILDIFSSIIEANETFNYKIDDKFKETIDYINFCSTRSDAFKYTPQIADSLLKLWDDDGIKKTILEGSKFDLLDSTPYIIKNLKRFSEKDFVPTPEDILRIRTKTVGIVQERFNSENMKLLFVDVGGQRNERRKWIHAFDGVTCVFFITSLSDYDQQLEEDRKTNRMIESLNLYTDVCNDRGFKKKSCYYIL